MKKFKKFIIIYLIIGVAWSSYTQYPFGEMLKDYEGNKEYWNRITDVTKSYLTDTGELVLCMRGRLAYSERYLPEITGFFLSIPIHDIESTKAYKNDFIDFSDLESNVIILSDKLIDNGCNDVREINPIQIKHAEYSPKKAYYFYSKRDLRDLKPENNEDFMVFIVPTANSYKGLHFVEPIDVFIILKNKDAANRHFYAISLEPTWIDRDIGFGEYAIAFVKDALFYPAGLYMMFNW